MLNNNKWKRLSVLLDNDIQCIYNKALLLPGIEQNLMIKILTNFIHSSNFFKNNMNLTSKVYTLNNFVMK